MMNYKLLNDVQNIYKTKQAYTPPPNIPQSSMQAYMMQGMNPNAVQQGVQQDMMAQQQGMDIGALAQQQAALQQQGMDPAAAQQQAMLEQQQAMMEQQQGSSQQGGQPPMANPESNFTDPQQILNFINEALGQNVPIEEIVKILMEKGVPEEMVQQALSQAPVQENAPPQEGEAPPQDAETPPQEEQQEPIDIRSIMDETIQGERKKLKEMQAAPEDRLFSLEKKVDILTDMVQELMGGMNKASSDKAYIGILEESLKALNM